MGEKQIVIHKTQDTANFQEYLLERECSDATVKKYLTDVSTFFKYLRIYGAKERPVEKRELLDYKEWLLTQYKVSSANSMLAALNQFLESKNEGRFKLKRFKVQRSMLADEEKEMDRQEYERLVKAARVQKKDQLSLIIQSLCGLGIRVSELRFLTVNGIHKGHIIIYNKGKIRKLPIPEQLRKKLLYYTGREKIREGQIFLTKNGKPKDRSNIWREMRMLHEEADVPLGKIFPHNLRHLFAKTFYSTTHNLVELADILGHSDLAVTRIYLSKKSDQFREEMDSLKLIL